MPAFPSRHPLGFFPTPLHRLGRLTARLGGPELWIKRDDQTGLALGGNKTRKLEFLIGQALGENCDCVITAGAAQSNHCRQTAAAAAAAGLACHLVLGGAPENVPSGNLLLDQLLGATIHWTGNRRKGEGLPEIATQLRRDGIRPFEIPYGGSNPAGASGFALAMQELTGQEQGRPFEAIVFASSSGGTHAGLLVGKEMTGSHARIIGIRIDKEEMGCAPFAAQIACLANETAALLEVAGGFATNDIVLHEGYTGAGYGRVGDLERNAIRTLARTEGILLDPVYTGRAFGALLDLIARGAFESGERILFWHTGGAPALFSCAPALAES